MVILGEKKHLYKFEENDFRRLTRLAFGFVQETECVT